jgi:hypothetical protein
MAMNINIKQIRSLFAIYALLALFAKFVIAPFAIAEDAQLETRLPELAFSRR